MSSRRRLIFWIIACLFIGLTTAYLAWTPYREADLYRVIPAHAILVSSHRDMAARWPDLSTNLMLRAFINPAGSTAEHPNDSNAIKMWERVCRLGRKDTVIAYVPALGAAGQPAWMGASWIGSASYYLRWSLYLKRIPGLDRLPNYCNGRPIWRFRRPLTGSGMQLSLAFGEGVILGCLSRNPDAMRHVLMAYDGLTPSIVSAPSYHPDSFPFRPGIATDQGWFRWFQPGRKLNETLTLSYAISRLDAKRLSAEIRVQPGFKPRVPLSETLDVPAFGQLLGDLPALIMILPLDIVRELLSQAPMTTGYHVIRQALRSDVLAARDNNVVITLLAGDYSGGIGKEPFRMKIPTLMIFLKTRDPGEIKSMIGKLTDNLNAHYQLGLIVDPTPLPAGKLAVNAVETTRPSPLSALANEDHPAYAAVGPWLILSSNAQSLIKLLERYQRKEALDNASASRWQKHVLESKSAACLWLDLDACGRVLQLPLAALAPVRRGEPAAPASDRGDLVKNVRTWLEDVRPLKTGAFWMDSTAPDPNLHLAIGE